MHYQVFALKHKSASSYGPLYNMLQIYEKYNLSNTPENKHRFLKNCRFYKFWGCFIGQSTVVQLYMHVRVRSSWPLLSLVRRTYWVKRAK